MDYSDSLPFELKVEIKDFCLEVLEDGEEVLNERVVHLDQGSGIFDMSFDFQKGLEDVGSYLHIRLDREMLEKFLAEIHQREERT